MRRAAWLCLLAGCILPEAAPLARFEFAETHMGGRVRVVLYAPDQAHADRAAKTAFAEVAAIDASMSDYKPLSEISLLANVAGTGNGTRGLSAPLMEVLVAARICSELSGGAFDVTIGPLVQLWRRSRREGKLPSPEEIAAAKALVDYRSLWLSPEHRTACLMKKGMRLDLGAIAKGYACDRALVALAREGLTAAMVETSGGYAFGDPPPGRDGWRIQVADDEEKVLVLKRCGVATSGDTEQFVEIDGVRYSHIVDPATGLGLTNRAMVTVVAPDGRSADALSTTVSLMGPDRGIQLAEKLDRTEALYRWVEGGRVRSSSTSGFSAHLFPE